MTNFVKSNFKYSGGWLTYEGKFVARFKYVKADKTAFLKFLIANFTVEEYFTRLNVFKESPLGALQSKGFVLPRVQKILAQA